MAQLEHVRPDERLLFLGESGCGKTTLARAFLSSGWHPRYVVLDQKNDFALDSAADDIVITDPQDKRWKKPPDHIIYRPHGVFNTGPWLDWVLWRCYERGRQEGKTRPFVVYVDEAFGLARTGSTKWLSNLATQGRSIGASLWVSSQRPKWIPTEIRSEASRWYIFHLGFEEDEEEVIKYMKQGRELAQRRAALAYLQESTENYAFVEMKKDRKRAGHRLIQRIPPIQP